MSKRRDMDDVLDDIFETNHAGGNKIVSVVGFIANDDQDAEDVRRAMRCLIAHAAAGHGLLPMPKQMLRAALDHGSNVANDDDDDMFGMDLDNIDAEVLH